MAVPVESDLKFYPANPSALCDVHDPIGGTMTGVPVYGGNGLPIGGNCQVKFLNNNKNMPYIDASESWTLPSMDKSRTVLGGEFGFSTHRPMEFVYGQFGAQKVKSNLQKIWSKIVGVVGHWRPVLSATALGATATFGHSYETGLAALLGVCAIALCADYDKPAKPCREDEDND